MSGGAVSNVSPNSFLCLCCPLGQIFIVGLGNEVWEFDFVFLGLVFPIESLQPNQRVLCWETTQKWQLAIQTLDIPFGWSLFA